jgi:hypothetical protein
MYTSHIHTHCFTSHLFFILLAEFSYHFITTSTSRDSVSAPADIGGKRSIIILTNIVLYCTLIIYYLIKLILIFNIHIIGE